MPSSLRITLTPLADPTTVAARWRQLETEAEGSFFQSWTWVGCLAQQRFPRPALLSAERDGRTVALALCNRHGPVWDSERLSLGESGDPAWDAIYVEHNGPLLARDSTEVLPLCLRALLRLPLAPRRSPRGRWLRLAGVNDAHLAAAEAVGAVRHWKSDPAPWIDLTRLVMQPDGIPDHLSANTRYQLRRSLRRYTASGPLRVRRADTVATARADLEALAVLHQAGWQMRGQPGAFANPAFRQFHQALLERGVPRQETDLLHITAGDRTIGYLYNFVHHGRVLSYQSGFNYSDADPHQKPGLICHLAALTYYQAAGMQAYDFLAGNSRYKTGFANRVNQLHWLDLAPRGSVRGIMHWLLRQSSRHSDRSGPLMGSHRSA